MTGMTSEDRARALEHEIGRWRIRVINPPMNPERRGL